MESKVQIRLLKICVFFLLAALSTNPAAAQEFNCEVNINSRQISGTAYDYVSELKNDLENYINGYRWTDDRYREQERIACGLQVVLTGVDNNFNYTAEVVITLRRPIYNTNRQSLVLLINDNNWRFSYPQNEALIHDELQFDDLTSFIDFYAYIMLGFDYDTFEELGGSQFYNEAQSVFELGQNSGTQGWGRSIGAQRNRFGLISDLMNPAYEDFRRALYLYHRQGLDQFTMNPDSAREQILQSIELIRETKRITNNNYLFDIFFGTKYTEIVALFNDAGPDVRTRAYNLLRDVDPAHSNEYENLQTR